MPMVIEITPKLIPSPPTRRRMAYPSAYATADAKANTTFGRINATQSVDMSKTARGSAVGRSPPSVKTTSTIKIAAHSWLNRTEMDPSTTLLGAKGGRITGPQALIDAARAELAKLLSARPAAEIDALIRGAAANPRGSHAHLSERIPKPTRN